MPESKRQRDEAAEVVSGTLPHIDVQQTARPYLNLTGPNAPASDWYLAQAARRLLLIQPDFVSDWIVAGAFRSRGGTRDLAWTSWESTTGRQLVTTIDAASVIREMPAKVGVNFRGLCLLDVMSLGELKQASEDYVSVKAEIGELERSVRAASAPFDSIETALANHSGQWALAVNAPESVLIEVGILGRRKLSPYSPVMPVLRGEHSKCFQALADLVQQQPIKYQLVVSLTSLPDPCFLDWVWEEKRFEIRQVIDNALDAADLSKSRMPSDARGSLTRVQDVWLIVRGELKERLEQVIAALSQTRLGSYAEKSALVDELNREFEHWGFRAVSPSTGVPAYLVCRSNERNPRGYFSLVDIPGAERVAEPDSDAPKAPSQLPRFALHDAKVPLNDEPVVEKKFKENR